MNFIIENTSSGLLRFCCVISGIVKGLLEILTVRVALSVIISYKDTIMPNLEDVENASNTIDIIIKTLKEISPLNESIMLYIVLLIIGDLLISYSIHLLCREISDKQSPKATDILNNYISDFFYGKKKFIAFIISNLSTIIKSENQVLETVARNIIFTVSAVTYCVKSEYFASLAIAFIFLSCIFLSHMFQIHYNKKLFNIDPHQLNALNKFIDEYRQINDKNYLIYGYLIIILIIYEVRNEFSSSHSNPVAFMFIFVLLLRIILNLKISKMPMYLKQLTENIQNMLSKVIIVHEPSIVNENNYESILVKGLNVSINYNNKNVNMIHDIDMEFKLGEMYVISSDAKGKTILLNSLLKPLHINNEVFFISKSGGEHSINDIKDLEKTCVIINNESEIGEIKYIYDFLIDSYNTNIKRMQICRIMNYINKDIPFVGIDNEVFVDFSPKEINDILGYIEKNCHLSNKIIILTLKETSINTQNINVYNIKNGELIKV